ncbi:MAG: alpha-N-arabinofuranosidase [Candidatus Aminicenantes bacterium]|nr:alpha-N-arabinofuranosidase [Candidatus Aminicenantes bacterium]
MRNWKNILSCLALPLFITFGFVFAVNEENQPDRNRIVINADLGKDTIDKNIYGHFSEHLGRCIYDGYWAGEDSPVKNVRGIRSDIVEALKKIKIPVLRWPGGCFADEYHWKDGIGPREERPTMINTHWGRVIENNHFGTHEFLDLCEQLGCEPYVCGNVGSGTVREMQEWIEYITFDGQSPVANLRRRNGREEPWKLKFFGVGNENWGCGGNMTPEHYANLYRRYQTYVRSFSGNRIYRIACGSYGENYKWTDVLMREAGRMMNGLSFHYYIVPGGWGNKNSATQFEEKDWFETLQKALFMDELLTRHSAIMDRYDPNKRVGMIVDEWGTWYQVESGTNPSFLYQQNSLRDAVVAGVVLNIFNSHCERVKMANLAQTINVLQSLVLTQEEKMVVTPTYHVFDMYKVHQDAILLPVDLECRQYELEGKSIPALSASASRDKEGKIHVSLCNLNPNQPLETVLEFRGVNVKNVKGTILTADKMTAHNSFNNPENLKPAGFKSFQMKKGAIVATLPPKSVVILEIFGVPII